MDNNQYSKWVRDSGILIVISGPSGVGKDAVLEELLRIYPNAQRCVTVTTRPPRDNEINGVDYTFVSEDDFQKLIDNGSFLEHAIVHGNRYGTPKKWVIEKLSEKIDIILKIDVQGGLEVKKQKPDAVIIFLCPPSLEELEKRLRGRNTELESDIQVRLKNARGELDMIAKYDYVVVNDDLRIAAEELRSIIIAEHRKIRK